MNIIKESLVTFKKNKFITLTTIVVLTFNLFVVGIFAILIINLNLFLENIKENVEVALFLKEGLNKEEIDKILIEAKMRPGVDDCVFVSKEDALKEFGETDELKDYINAIDVNPLPDSIRVNINKNYKSIERVRNLVDSLKTINNIIEVHYQKEEMERLFGIVNVIKSIMLGLSLILITSLILIASGAIRISIFARKEEIKSMRLSGMSNWFIKSIFIVECIIQGLISSILATILLYVLEKIVYDKINIIWSGRWLVVNYKFALFIILLGVSIGFLSSLLFRIKYYSE
ncbi:MAG: permease-like cell division protein FtsX [Candidatus Firestonebacteria bacterium]